MNIIEPARKVAKALPNLKELESIPTKTNHHVEVARGKHRWFWRLVGRNGETIAVSQKYHSRSNAMRAARKLGKANNYKVLVSL